MCLFYQANWPTMKGIISLQSQRFIENKQNYNDNFLDYDFDFRQLPQQINNSSLSITYRGFNLGEHVGDNPQRVALFRKYLQLYYQNQINSDHDQYQQLIARTSANLRQNNQQYQRNLPREIPKVNIHWLNQVHGVAVHYASAATISTNITADAAWTDQAGQVCAVMTADCLPILLRSTDNEAAPSCVAAIHAGWRSLLHGAIENCLYAMRHKYPDSKFQAWLGPAISAKKFIVGSEVVEAFCAYSNTCHSAFYPAEESGKFHTDLYQLARQRLNNLGVEQIFGDEDCTYSQPERFFSYRRDQQCGRMVSTIAISDNIVNSKSLS